jgi:hypothetical protein
MLRRAIAPTLFALAILVLPLSEAPAETGPAPWAAIPCSAAVPKENDANLENVVVRIGDGAILAQSHGAYWDLGTKIAKARVAAAWSPDSRIAVKVEQREESASAELFAFSDDDTAIGPFELADLLKPALLAKMQATANPADYNLVFFFRPAITIDDQNRIHLVLCAALDGTDGPRYEATIGVPRTGNILAAKIELHHTRALQLRLSCISAKAYRDLAI